MTYPLCFKFGIINFARVSRVWSLMYVRIAEWVSNWVNEAKVSSISQCINLVPYLTTLYRLGKVLYVV
jgi:hypothetical protein